MKLVPVDHDPFAGPKLVPVDYDPFTAPEDKGLASRIGEDLMQRESNIQSIKQRAARGEINSLRSGIRQLGQAAGAYTDVIGEGLSEVTPDFVKRGFLGVVNAAGQLPSFSGRTIGEDIPQELGMLAEQYPEAAQDVEAVANIGMFAAPVRAPKGKGLIKTKGEKIKVAGEKQAFQSRENYLTELVRPKQTPSVKEAQVPRTIETKLLNKKVQPSLKETEMAGELRKIPNIGKQKTLQGNYNVIQKEVGTEADRLKTLLVKNDVLFPKEEVKAALKSAASRLEESPLVTGDAAISAQRIMAKMESLLDEMPKSSASYLLEARKKLDQWMKSQKGGDIFDPARENAISIALREIRTATNDFIASKATSVPVKQSLKRQSTLYSAMENIAPKAADEAPNVIARSVQNITKTIPLKGELLQNIATLIGATGAVGAVAAFPKVVLGAAGTYGAYKGLTSPQVKKALGELLIQTDKAIRLTKSREIIQQMRVDRAALLEIIKSLPDDSVRNQSTPDKSGSIGKQEKPYPNYMQNQTGGQY